MTGLGIFRRTEEERKAASDRYSVAHTARHERQRDAALVAMLVWPNGTAPLVGLPITILRALASRGLVEVRFHLTPQGRKAAEKARDR